MLKIAQQTDGHRYLHFEDYFKEIFSLRCEKFGFFKQKRDEGFVTYFSGFDIVIKKRQNRQTGEDNLCAATSFRLTCSFELKKAT